MPDQAAFYFQQVGLHQLLRWLRNTQANCINQGAVSGTATSSLVIALTISERHLVSELDILVQSSSESLHANFITAVEATKSKDQLDIDILLKITADKGPLMEQIRRYHLAEVQGLNPDDKAAILHITDLYQRTVWLLNSWTKYIKPGLEA